MLSEPVPNDLFQDWGTYRYYYTVKVRNESALAVISNNSIPNASELGEIGYIIQDKSKNEFYFKTFKGGSTGVVGFGQWLAATVNGYNRSVFYIERGERNPYDFNKEIPGREYRRPDFASPEEEGELFEESENFDVRAKSFGSYYPGILFLFNVSTRAYIEWETFENGEPQGDSEILLVENEMVYYRINDKIYQAPILDGKKLGNAKLLLKDDRVPDIHWAFFSKN